MKKFVELIQRVHNERFSVVMNKIVAEKIPVAFLSLEHINNAVEIVKKLRGQNLNITTLITLEATPLPDLAIEFEILHLNEFMKLPLRPKYILVIGNIEARIAIKYFPDCVTLNIDRGNTDNRYEVFMTHLKDLQEVYESLIDEESKKTFCGYWLGTISNQMKELVYTKSAHYLLAGFIPEQDAIVIDGGAFDGGTATVFSEMGYKVYAFEMDVKNFERIKPIAAEKNFVIENFSLGSYKHTMRYNADGGSGSTWRNDGLDLTQVTTIDAYVRENKLPSVDFIKLDVEGAELDILKGAKTSIARYKPILAISAYHKLEDFWTLMNFIKAIRPDYEFALRQGYESPEEEPLQFQIFNETDMLYSLGLEPVRKYFWEVVLFAR